VLEAGGNAGGRIEVARDLRGCGESVREIWEGYGVVQGSGDVDRNDNIAPHSSEAVLDRSLISRNIYGGNYTYLENWLAAICRIERRLYSQVLILWWVECSRTRLYRKTNLV
jgi:hypothetical protein